MQAQDWVEVLVPLVVFSALIALLALLLFYKFRKKKLFLAMIEAALDRGASLSPETIREVATHFFAPDRDFRKGLLLLMTSLSIFGFSFFADFKQRGNLDLNDAINGIAVLPGLIGLAFMLLHWLDSRSRR